MRPSSILSLAVITVTCTAVYAQDARACPPKTCYGSARYSELELLGTEVGTDGWLLFSFDRSAGLLDDTSSLAWVTLTVTTTDGETLEGELVALENPRALAWQPTDLLPPNTMLSVEFSVDNSALDDLGECGEDLFERNFAIGTLPGLSGELPSIVVVGAPELVLNPYRDRLESQVCCDGAVPETQVGACTNEVFWQQGFCIPHEGVGRLQGTLQYSAGIKPEPARLSGVAYNLVTDGSPAPLRVGGVDWPVVSDTPFCAQLAIVNLATGATQISAERCFGDDVADQLGQQELDITAELDAQCSQTPQTCTVVLDSWDPKDCMPWEPMGGTGSSGGTDSDSGCISAGCDSDSIGSDSVGSGPDSDTDTGSTDGDSGGQQNGAADRGCGCTSSTPSPAGLGVFLIAALGWWRRRIG